MGEGDIAGRPLQSWAPGPDASRASGVNEGRSDQNSYFSKKQRSSFWGSRTLPSTRLQKEFCHLQKSFDVGTFPPTYCHLQKKKNICLLKI